ncbi:MAG: GNAT family N-acetyltransferase [Candidatus Thorarchaeota archaeon]|jgi:RimJ/RimL family protein N-acetyltransferase
MYEGKKTRLRRLVVADVNNLMKNWNKYELRQYLATPLPSTEQDMTSFINSANEAFSKKSKLTFGIESIETGSLVGIIDLANISWISGNGEITIFAIMNQEDRGKGYALDSMLLLLDVAFNVINLHSVYLWVVEFNNRAIDFYTKIGFKKGGALRELAFRNGQRYDVVIMDILKPEFVEKYGTLPKKDVL